MTSREPPRRSVPAWLVTSSEWAWRAILVAAGILLVGWLFLYLRLVTVPAFVALLVAVVLHPVVDRLRRRGWPNLLATWTAVLAALGIVVGVVSLLAPMVADQAEDLDEQLQGGIAEVEDWMETGPLGLEDVDLRSMWDRAADQVAESDQLIEGVSLAGEILAGALLTLVMAFFFVKDGPSIVSRVRTWIPVHRRDAADGAARSAWAALGAYVRGTAVVGIVNGTVIGIGLAIIGVPLAVPLAVITALSAFFPLVGAVVAGAVAVLVALFSGGVTDALLVLGLVVIVQQVEGDVLSPLVMGRALRLHPLTILVALTVGAVVAGVLGAFLAVPLVGVATGAVAGARRAGEDADPGTVAAADPYPPPG